MRARLFGEGLAGGGEPVEVRWFGGRLHLDGEGIAWEAGVAGAATSGFNGGEVRVDLDRPSRRGLDGRAPGDGAHALFVDPRDRGAFAAGAPAALAGSLSAAATRSERSGRRSRAALGVLVLLSLLPLAAFGLLLARSDAVAGWAVARIPVEAEARLGDLVLAQARAGAALRDEGPAVEAVRRIGERFTGGSRHRYRWFVAERPDANAFAAPGGVVVVHRGLLDAAASPEEVAGVLAHEVAHAELRHGLRAMVKSLGLRAVAAAALGDVDGTIAGAALDLTELKYSRDAERQADAEALRRLVAAKVDPAGLVAFLERLEAKGGPGVPSLLSTHPGVKERIADLRERIARLGGGPYVPLDVDWR